MTQRAISVAAIMFATMAQNALAQSSPETPPQPAAQDEGVPTTEGLEEIVVTAQRRSERLQDVPIAISAITGEALVWSKNLLGKEYYSNVSVASSGDQGSPAAPRTFGAAVDWTF